jgi:hypothetical protein
MSLYGYDLAQYVVGTSLDVPTGGANYMSKARLATTMRYGAWGKTELVHTRSRRATGLVLLTFSEENDPRRASGCGLKSLVFDSGA